MISLKELFRKFELTQRTTFMQKSLSIVLCVIGIEITIFLKIWNLILDSWDSIGKSVYLASLHIILSITKSFIFISFEIFLNKETTTRKILSFTVV